MHEGILDRVPFAPNRDDLATHVKTIRLNALVASIRCHGRGPPTLLAQGKGDSDTRLLYRN